MAEFGNGERDAIADQIADQMPRWVKFPGAVFRVLHTHATLIVADDYGEKSDMDLADAMSRAHIKARGAGFQAFIEINREQAGRLANWIEPRHPKLARDYAAALREFSEKGAPSDV